MKLFAFALVTFIVCSASLLHAQTKSLEVSVVDSTGQPVVNADVEVRKWTGEYAPTDFRGNTDETGRLLFEDFGLRSYCYLLVRHPDFAPVAEAFSGESKGVLEVTVRLAPPLSNFLRILSPDGKPIAGAEITRLEYSSKLANSKSFLSHELASALLETEGWVLQSDPEGRLFLPPLPSDAEMTITVTHPEWAVGKLESVKLADLHQRQLELEKGTRIEAYFSGTPEALSKLEGQRIRLSTHDRADNDLMHHFKVQDSKTSFALPPSRYDSLYMNVEGVVITPTLPSSFKLAEFWNIPEADTVQKTFVVRELFPTIGRVVDKDGKAVEGEDLSIQFDNLYIDENGMEQTVAEHPTTFVFATSDQNGSFQVDLPRGKISMSIYWTGGYFSDPVEVTFDYAGEPNLPDFVVIPKPTVTGIVVDEQDQPVPNAIVRFLTANLESAYSIADSNASYAIPVTEFAYDRETEKQSFILEICAFDLDSDQCCIQKIDVSDEVAVKNCKLTIVSRDPTWLMDEIRRRQQARFDEMVASSNYIAEEIKAEDEKQKAKPKPDPRAPELSGGHWFNTDARSLDEFRGKFVLLDFWFIGCGPCERGIPNLKQVHQQFRDQNFTVIGVHTTGQQVDTVRQFAEARKITYPMVVDSAEEPILEAYRPLGVRSFPTYILVDPEGNIDNGSGLHGSFLEYIREKMLLQNLSKTP